MVELVFVFFLIFGICLALFVLFYFVDFVARYNDGYNKKTSYVSSYPKKEFDALQDIVLDDTKFSTFPDKNYHLIVTKYINKYHSWCESVLFDDDKKIKVIDGKKDTFPFCWVSHPNKHDYLIYSHELTSYAIYELDTYKLREVTYDRFSYDLIKPSPNGLFLAVFGRNYGEKNKINIVDFKDPMLTNPLPVISSINFDIRDFYWTSDNTLEMIVDAEFNKPMNKYTFNMTKMELDENDGYRADLKLHHILHMEHNLTERKNTYRTYK